MCPKGLTKDREIEEIMYFSDAVEVIWGFQAYFFFLSWLQIHSEKSKSSHEPFILASNRRVGYWLGKAEVQPP